MDLLSRIVFLFDFDVGALHWRNREFGKNSQRPRRIPAWPRLPPRFSLLENRLDFGWRFFLSVDPDDFQNPALHVQMDEVAFLDKRNRAAGLRFRRT